MSGDIVAMRVRPPLGSCDVDATLAPALAVLRLGLDLLAAPDSSLDDHNRRRLVALLAAATTQARSGAAHVLHQLSVEPAA